MASAADPEQRREGSGRSDRHIPLVVRVERIFSNSALGLRDHGCGSDVSSRKTSSSEETSAMSSWIGTPAANARSPSLSVLTPAPSSPCSFRVVASICSCRNASSSVVRFGVRTRTEPPTRRQLFERGLGDELAAVDDQHLVDGLGDLGEYMAGDQHGPAGGGEGAQEVAQPAHALRVEPVAGSSRISSSGSPRSAAAIPRRCRIPSE